MRIEFRLGLILTLCFAFGVAVVGYISYTLEFRGAREEVNEKSRVLLEMGTSMRSYTSEEIAPLVSELGMDKDFHPQLVPSYAAQSTLQRLRKQFPEYLYRESSLNPTNVADRASDWEVGLIRAFQSDAKLTETYGETGEGASLRYYLAQPLRMTSPDCLQCHSTPDVAPKPMLAKYGASSGFAWAIGDVIGIQVVEVPVLHTKLKALHGVLATVGSLICVLVLTFAIFLLLLRRYVTGPLESITSAARSSSLGARATDGIPPIKTAGQFYDLEQSIFRLKVSLDEAMRLFTGLNGPDRKK